MSPDDEFPTMLGHEIKFWREYRQLSRGELANRAGLSASTIGRMERAETSSAASDTIKVARALGIGFEDLVSRAQSAVSIVVRSAGATSEASTKSDTDELAQRRAATDSSDDTGTDDQAIAALDDGSIAGEQDAHHST